LRVKDDVVWCGAPFEITSGETVDLGALETAPLSSLVVTVVRPAGFTGPVFVRPKYFEAPRAKLKDEDAVTTFDLIASGTIEVEAKGNGIATEIKTVEIVPGVRNTCEIALRAATGVEVVCSLRQPQGFRAVTLTVDDAEGKRWLRHWRREAHVYEWPHKRKVNLPAGIYTLRLETSDGQTAERTVEIDGKAASTEVPIRAQ
ncbi:MAG: hypothetical protein AAGG01_21730, partial [Planctomycetota bacterium]